MSCSTCRNFGVADDHGPDACPIDDGAGVVTGDAALDAAVKAAGSAGASTGDPKVDRFVASVDAAAVRFLGEVLDGMRADGWRFVPPGDDAPAGRYPLLRRFVAAMVEAPQGTPGIMLVDVKRQARAWLDAS